MSEKYSVMMDGREPWFHRDNYPMTHDEVCETLNTQSTEIAGLRETVEGLREHYSPDEIQTRRDLAADRNVPAAIRERCRQFLKALGVEVPDAAKGG